MAIKDVPFDENFRLFSRTSKVITIRWYTKAGDPILLANWDAWMPFGPTYAAPVGELTVANGGIVLDNDGLIQITFTSTLTAALAANPEIPVEGSTGTVLYNLMLKDPMLAEPLGVKPFMRGKLFIEQTVARPE